MEINQKTKQYAAIFDNKNSHWVFHCLPVCTLVKAVMQSRLKVQHMYVEFNGKRINIFPEIKWWAVNY